MFHVTLNCVLGNEQLLPDVPVPISACDVREYLDFPRRKRFVAQMLSEAHGKRWGHSPLSRVDLADRSDQLRWRHAFEHVPPGSSLKCALDLDIALER